MYKNFTLTESERESILNQHMDHGYKQPMNEQVKQPTGDFTTIGRFGSSDAKTLKERGFIVKGGVATLNHPHPKLVVTVKPSQKGWAAYQGGVLKFDLPHDHCDVELDKLIGYNSLQGGYKKPMNEQVSTDNISVKQVVDILKSKGFTMSSNSGYKLLMVKNSEGPVKNKDGSYIWNYEAYIPTVPGNQLWIGKRRRNMNNENGLPESSYVVITLSGPIHKMLYVNNGKTVKTEDVNTMTAMDYITSYEANF